MAASRDLPFPLVIICLLFIRGYYPLPTTSQVKPEPIPTDDYTLFEDTVTPILPNRVSPHGGIPQKCDYSPCVENQTPCSVLSESGCLCPGFSPYDVVPGVPDLKSVSWNGSEVVIQWCEPYSYVTGYVVTVGGQERRTFGKNQRSGGVGDIDHIAEVCVFAVNESGESNGSCKMYHPGDNSQALKAGLIGGALGFLLLLLLAVLLWRHKRQRKPEAGISMHDAADTQ